MTRLVVLLLWFIGGCVCAFALFTAARLLYREHGRRHMYDLPLHERLGRFGHAYCRERFWAKAKIDLLDRVMTQAELESAEHSVLDLPPRAWQHGQGCGVCWREARLELVHGEEAVCGNGLCQHCGCTRRKPHLPCVVCERLAASWTFFCEEHDWADWQALVDRTATVAYRSRPDILPARAVLDRSASDL